MKLNEKQLAACKPIVERLIPAQETVDACKAHLGLLLDSWGIDFASVQVDFATGEMRSLRPPEPESEP